MKTKTCTKCNIEKPETDFRWKNKAKGWRTPWCRICYAVHEKKTWESRPERRDRVRATGTIRYDRNRKYVFDFFSTHPCVDCPESDPVVLEFDHRDPTEKRASVSDLVGRGVSLETLKNEIDKCDVRCANCHRKKTAKQLGWHKF